MASLSDTSKTWFEIENPSFAKRHWRWGKFHENVRLIATPGSYLCGVRSRFRLACNGRGAIQWSWLPRSRPWNVVSGENRRWRTFGENTSISNVKQRKSWGRTFSLQFIFKWN
jgi:hypothetical protein